MTEMSRAEHIAAMRQLLLVLEAHPEVPMPSNWGTNEYNSIHFFTDKPEVVAAIVAGIGGEWVPNKADDDTIFSPHYVKLTTQFAGCLCVDVSIMRKTMEKHMKKREAANDEVL